MAAEQPEPAQRLERGLPVADVRRLDNRAARADGLRAHGFQAAVGAGASAGIQVTSAGEALNAWMTASSSPERTAAATAPIAPPNRYAQREARGGWWLALL
jgi:hypothetical protein